jgi:hypothetical protein
MSLLLSRFNFHVPANGVSAANAKLAAPITAVREIAFRNNFIGALLAWFPEKLAKDYLLWVKFI